MKLIRFSLQFTLLFVASIIVSQAQDYVITTRGDTLRGTVRVMNYGTDKKVQITDASKKKSFVSMFQVAVVSAQNEIYHPVKGPFEYAFMKLKKAGYLSLYNFQLKDQANFDGVFLLKKDGAGIEAPNLNFKRVLREFLKDCPETTEKVDNGTFGRKQLTEIVDDYNACITRRTNLYPQATAVVSTTSSEPWAILLKKVESMDFDGKSDVIDMINEVSGKISRGEKVPNFLLEGLKTSLKDRAVDAELQAALATVK